MDADRACRAGGVRHQAGTLEVVQVRDPAGDQSFPRTRQLEWVTLGEHLVVGDVGLVTPQEHTRARAFGRITPIAGVLKGLVRDLEGDPLVWVHILGLDRRNAEQVRIERVDAIEIAALGIEPVEVTVDHRGSQDEFSMVRVAQDRVHVLFPEARVIADRGLSLLEVLPELVDAVCGGEPPSHADDGDVADPLPGLQVQQEFLRTAALDLLLYQLSEDERLDLVHGQVLL